MNTVLCVHQSIGLSKRVYLLGDFLAIFLRGFQALKESDREVYLKDV